MTNEEWHIFSHREHRWTEHTKVRKIAAPPPTPPPKGRGVITEIPMWGGCRLLFASLLVSTIAETLCVLCMPKAFCVLEMCAKRLSELCALCERKNLYEVCKQPNRGNLTYHAPPCGGGVGGGATSSWARNCAQKGSVNSVRSVREKTPQRVVCVLYHTVGAFYFSQKNTEEQISQRPTETLSQPISQNLTAIFGSNALRTLYAGGLLWARNSAKKMLSELCALCER